MNQLWLFGHNLGCVGSIGATPIGHETRHIMAQFDTETLPRKPNQVDLKINLIWVTCIPPRQNDQINSVYSFGHNLV